MLQQPFTTVIQRIATAVLQSLEQALHRFDLLHCCFEFRQFSL